MSKIRNRSVRTLPTHEITFEWPIINQCDIKKRNATPKFNLDYFGEKIIESDSSDETSDETITSRNCECVDNLSGVFSKLNSGLSSASSLSWSDEYDSETSKRVRNELYRLDRVFRRLEPIPPHYDKKEIKEWMEFFPNLTILDSPVTSNKLQEKQGLRTTPTLVVHPEDSHCSFNICDSDFTSREFKKLREAVIDTIYDKVSNRLLNRRISTNSKKRTTFTENKNNKLFSVSYKPKIVDLDNYLKVSPIKSTGKFERKPSSKSLIDTQALISSTLDQDESEFTSLPFLSEENGISKLNSSTANRRKINSNTKRRRNFILPPIDNSSQFRSISATPRHNKSVSPFSSKLNVNFLNKKPKTQFDISKFLSNNSLGDNSPHVFSNR